MKFKKRKFGFYASTLPIWSVVATILAMPNRSDTARITIYDDDPDDEE